MARNRLSVYPRSGNWLFRMAHYGWTGCAERKAPFRKKQKFRNHFQGWNMGFPMNSMESRIRFIWKCMELPGGRRFCGRCRFRSMNTAITLMPNTSCIRFRGSRPYPLSRTLSISTGSVGKDRVSARRRWSEIRKIMTGWWNPCCHFIGCIRAEHLPEKTERSFHAARKSYSILKMESPGWQLGEWRYFWAFYYVSIP